MGREQTARVVASEYLAQRRFMTLLPENPKSLPGGGMPKWNYLIMVRSGAFSDSVQRTWKIQVTPIHN